MRSVTFSELRNHAREYFDAVERGQSFEVYRNGKPVALLSPARSRRDAREWLDAWKPLDVSGVSLSEAIIAEREETYGA